jgi:hypothetical protein
LEIESLMQTLSEEMLKLKSASEHYEETKTNLQKMCESIDKISQTNQKLAEKTDLAIAEMEKTNLENKNTQEFIQNLYDEAKHTLEVEEQKHEESIKAALIEKFNDLTDEVRKQADKILQDNANQSEVLNEISKEIKENLDKIHQHNAHQEKSMTTLKGLAVIGIVLEAIIIIRILLF